MWKTISAIIGAVVLLGTVAGGVLYLDDRHAHSTDLNSLESVTVHKITVVETATAQTLQAIQTSIQKTNKRIDAHVVEQRIDGITQQMWNIENRCNTRDTMAMPEAERERYRVLRTERHRLEQKLKGMTDNGE